MLFQRIPGPPLRLFQKVIDKVASGEFCPDLTLSGYFAAGQPDDGEAEGDDEFDFVEREAVQESDDGFGQEEADVFEGLAPDKDQNQAETEEQKEEGGAATSSSSSSSSTSTSSGEQEAVDEDRWAARQGDPGVQGEAKGIAYIRVSPSSV